MAFRLAPSRSRWLPVVALLAPAFAFLAAFTYWPVLRVLGESVMVGRFAGQHALGFDNYRRLFADPHFARAAWNNAAYAFGTIVPSLVLALLFALRCGIPTASRRYCAPSLSCRR
jgi:sn-glycerol 3-phosphate transport system permease protein